MQEKVLGKTGIRVSVIGLGTTEIGYIYGIGPRNLPDEKEVIQFLHRVVGLGITFIDTGHFYGSAEERIGKSGVARLPGITVSTKCGHVLDREEDVSATELQRAMREEVEESLKKLKINSIPLVQIHGGSAEQIKSGVIQEVMTKLKDEGKVKHVGISTRGEEAPFAAIESGFFETLQLAHSILDQRMVSRVFAAAKEKNVGIINRSVLLKGVLTPAAKYLAPSLTTLRRNSKRASEIAGGLGTDLPSLSIRFALSNSAVDVVLVGSNKLKNVEAAVKAAESGPLPEDVLRELRGLAVEDINQVDPRFWPVESVADSKGGKAVHAK